MVNNWSFSDKNFEFVKTMQNDVLSDENILTVLSIKTLF